MSERSTDDAAAGPWDDERAAPIDTIYHIETPEGVDLALRVAGPLPRLYAWLLDLGIRVVAATMSLVVLAFLGDVGMGLYLLMLFGLEWIYPVAFEVLNDGVTPGKRLVGLRALRYDGTPVDLASSVLRNLLRVADFLPLLNLAGLVAMLCCGRFRRLGDLAAGTLVVYRDTPRRMTALPDVTPRPPPQALLLAEQRALVSFAVRGPRLSRARAAEVAERARPLFNGREPQDGDVVSALYAIAGWLIGRRPNAEPARDQR
jgi:uncharacterized RDD family membrane protein YckC